jgi:hypothetical protein
VEEPVVGILGGGGGDEHERIVARRESHLLRRRLPHERADDMGVRGPRTRVLELGKAGDECELAGSATVGVGEWRQPHLRAGAVERDSPALKAPANGQMGTLPEGATEGAAWETGAKGVDRKAGTGLGEDMGDERGARNTGELRG